MTGSSNFNKEDQHLRNHNQIRSIKRKDYSKNLVLFKKRVKKKIFNLFKKDVKRKKRAQNARHSISRSKFLDWRWPTDGRVIEQFSHSEKGNRGIDISGSFGQPILASANGRVVYAKNMLRGYGNLIIIKHNKDYLSAYAHNEKCLVHEMQKVKVGQKIATMGNTGTNTTRLHFEILYKGKSVNPLHFLP